MQNSAPWLHAGLSLERPKRTKLKFRFHQVSIALRRFSKYGALGKQSWVLKTSIAKEPGKVETSKLHSQNSSPYRVINQLGHLQCDVSVHDGVLSCSVLSDNAHKRAWAKVALNTKPQKLAWSRVIDVAEGSGIWNITGSKHLAVNKLTTIFNLGWKKERKHKKSEIKFKKMQKKT